MRKVKFRAYNNKIKQLASVTSLHYNGNVKVEYKKGKEIEGMFFGVNSISDDWVSNDIALMQNTGSFVNEKELNSKLLMFEYLFFKKNF